MATLHRYNHLQTHLQQRQSSHHDVELGSLCSLLYSLMYLRTFITCPIDVNYTYYLRT